MTAFDLRKALYNRNFYRFTGPPENWLTAIKFMTWGLEEKYMDRWKQIEEGDVFLMHSTVDSLFYKRPVSAIVGLGVVGGQFRIKKDFLWVQEIKNQVNKWPLLVPFSEVYLFSELPEASTWEAPGLGKDDQIPSLIGALLKNAIPTRAFEEAKFPVMGSWSGVKGQLVDELFSKATPVLYGEFYSDEYTQNEKPEFFKIKDAEDSVRYVPSLKFLDGSKVKVRTIAAERSLFERNNSLLEKAEKSHAEILEAAIHFFQSKGFDTWSNRHVDLLAESENQAFLVEVKSTVSASFRNQARRAIGQLFEYEHFDVRTYFENKSKMTPVDKVMMVTDDPNDIDYPAFLNTLRVHVAWPTGTRISVRGQPGELATLIQN